MDMVEWFKQHGILVNKEVAILIVDQAREWAYECEWENVDADDIMDMSDVAVVNNVRANWDGGLVDFINNTTSSVTFI